MMMLFAIFLQGDYEAALRAIEQQLSQDSPIDAERLVTLDAKRAAKDILDLAARYPVARGYWQLLQAASEIMDDAGVAWLFQALGSNEDLRLVLALNFSERADKELLGLSREGELRAWALAQVRMRRLSDPEPSDLGELIADLGSDSYRTRESASGKLREYGPRAARALIRVLYSQDAEVRVRARELMQEIRAGIGAIPDDPAPSLHASRACFGLVVDEGLRVVESGCSGLLKGDRILSVNGVTARSSVHFNQMLLRAGGGRSLLIRFVRNGQTLENEVTTLRTHLAFGRPIQHLGKFEEQYSGGGVGALTDGWNADANNLHSGWQGYLQDLEVIIDLGRSQPIAKVEGRFQQMISAGIVLPQRMEVQFSENGKIFTSAGKVENQTSDQEPGPLSRIYTLKTTGSARYIKVRAPCAGSNRWLFVDEVTVR